MNLKQSLPAKSHVKTCVDWISFNFLHFFLSSIIYIFFLSNLHLKITIYCLTNQPLSPLAHRCRPGLWAVMIALVFTLIFKIGHVISWTDLKCQRYIKNTSFIRDLSNAQSPVHKQLSISQRATSVTWWSFLLLDMNHKKTHLNFWFCFKQNQLQYTNKLFVYSKLQGYMLWGVKHNNSRLHTASLLRGKLGPSSLSFSQPSKIYNFWGPREDMTFKIFA